MSTVSAFTCGLEFPQWKADLLVHEIVIIMRRRTDTNTILLSSLGSILSPLAKDLLSSEKCKLKRFIAACTDNFEIDGCGGNQTCSFIGSEARYEQPSGVPEEMLQQTTLVATAGQMQCKEVIDEIAKIVMQRKKKCLYVSQIGTRLSSEARQWFKTNEVKLVILLAESPRFHLEDNKGQERVFLAAAPKSPTTAPKSTVSSSSTCDGLSRSSSASSELSLSCTAGNSPVSVLRDLLKNMELEALATMLVEQAPLCYED